MSTPSIGGIAKEAIGWSIGLSTLMIIAGILAIGMPIIAGIAATIVVGWLLIFSGVAHLVFGWHTRTTGNVIWELLLGVVYTWIGIDLLVHPVRGLVTLTLALVFYLVVEGVLELIQWFKQRSAPGSGWFLFDGIITLVLACMIWKTLPSNSEWVVGTLIGISMLFSGFTRLMISLAARRAVTQPA